MELVGRKKPGVGVTSKSTGGNRVTLTRIAGELGVSAMTVSNAYNHPDRLSEALRDRILETAERLGYQGPDPVGRSLRRQRTDVVGVLYSNPLSYAFDDPAAVSFLGGLSSVTEEADLGLLLVPAAGGASKERDPRAAAQAAVDGFVIYSMSDEEPLLAAALQRWLPAVVVDQPRKEGVPVYECQGSTRGLGYLAVEALFRSEQEPTAILASSDQLALGAMEWMSERRISVPQDVSVVGFDDIPAAASAEPPLTTIHQDHAEKGTMAGRMLVAQLHDEDAPSVEPLATHLVVRGSTSPNRRR